MIIGIYGGTFAPVHKAHVMIAEAFIAEFALDRLFVVPASIPPHKAVSAADNPTDRYNMTRLAFSKTEENITVSDVELKREGPSYTSDTLRYFKNIYQNDGLYMLCGEDMFRTLASWHEPEVIFGLAHIVCALRSENTAADRAEIEEKQKLYEKLYSAKISMLNIKPCPMSSTEIRGRIKNGQPTDEFLEPEVAAYIKEHGLYK